MQYPRPNFKCLSKSFKKLYDYEESEHWVCVECGYNFNKWKITIDELKKIHYDWEKYV